MFAFPFALFLSLLPVVANIFGYDERLGGCWYRGSGQHSIFIWEWVTFYGWIYASILYCAIVIIMVIVKLHLVAKQIDTFDFSSTSRSSSHPPLINKAMISSVVRRVIWYPVLPLAQIFGGINDTCYYVNSYVPYPLKFICAICLSLQGFLNALVFAQDIAVTRTFQAIKLQWWISIVNSYESHYPHKSYNKAIALVKSNDLNYNNADIIKSDMINDDWLRYMLLIKLFSPPKIRPREILSDHLSSINPFGDNEPSVLVDEGQGIKPVHLKDSHQHSSSSYYFKSVNSSEPLIGSSIEPTKRISRISEEIETTLERL
ncbi:22239_t:CDS:2 [Cetraspora pellucida]|uniref:22239_t:CDS:1 n=1 Tax=Cetraspora pellucida TaxID=1433469 RepID=A0A9N9GZ82_9GLOM|nr:22239_t:CDS:2 [Cetraspora pellucida]